VIRSRSANLRTSITVVATGFLFVVAMAGIARAAQITPTSSESVTIPAGAPGTTSGISDPYPSTLAVSWCQGTIQDVNIHLFLTHGATSDLEILLVGPGGQKALIAADSGDTTDVTSLSVTFDDEAGLTPPSPWVDGTYRPHDPSPGDVFPSPAPGGPHQAALSVFDGTNPNGTWNLYVNDDSGGDFGDLNWGLTIQTTSTAPSSTGVCISNGGVGEPYPTTITTSGLAAPIQDVDVTLNGLTHTWSDDLDVLLAGPGAKNTMLMSDAGGGGDISGASLTFNDEAANALPDGITPPIGTGTYQPTNHDSLENLPAPAPATQGTSLGAFDGLDPNGAWTLFVVDDDDIGDFGVVNNWSLQITTPGFTVSSAKAKEGKKATFTITRTGDLGQAVSASFATAAGSAKQKDFKALAGTLSFAAGDATEQVVVKTKNDNKDEKRNEKFTVNLTSGQATFTGTGKITDTDR
jgi:subtilisin-like proprotein convertase family protein